MDMAVVSDFKDRVSDNISAYRPEDVFNCDETEPLFRALPDKTLAQKNTSVKGGLSGEKLKTLVIGKAKNPKAFKGIDTTQLCWKANSKAWMNTILFAEWLQDANKRMKVHQRKILLYTDNVSSHVASDASLS